MKSITTIAMQFLLDLIFSAAFFSYLSFFHFLYYQWGILKYFLHILRPAHFLHSRAIILRFSAGCLRCEDYNSFKQNTTASCLFIILLLQVNKQCATLRGFILILPSFGSAQLLKVDTWTGLGDLHKPPSLSLARTFKFGIPLHWYASPPRGFSSLLWLWPPTLSMCGILQPHRTPFNGNSHFC